MLCMPQIRHDRLDPTGLDLLMETVFYEHEVIVLSKCRNDNICVVEIWKNQMQMADILTVTRCSFYISWSAMTHTLLSCRAPHTNKTSQKI